MITRTSERGRSESELRSAVTTGVVGRGRGFRLSNLLVRRWSECHLGRLFARLRTDVTLGAMKRAAIFFLLGASAFAEMTWEEKEIKVEALPTQAAAEVKFSFRNSGSHLLKITSVKTSCGCTTAALEKSSYAPGESGTILVTFDFGNRRGPQEKTIVVQTDDRTAAETTLLLTVNIPTVLEITPNFLSWRLGEESTPKTSIVKINPASGIRSLAVESSDEAVSATVEPVKPGLEYILRVTPANTKVRNTVTLTLRATASNTAKPRVFFAWVGIR